MANLGDPATQARLAILPFAALQWFVAYLLRYLPARIENPLIRSVAIIAFGAAIFGTWMIQGEVYRLMTGIYVLKGDNFFFALSLAEYAVTLSIIFIIAFGRRRKKRIRNNEETG